MDSQIDCVLLFIDPRQSPTDKISAELNDAIAGKWHNFLFDHSHIL